jgi:hypothetical protein
MVQDRDNGRIREVNGIRYSSQSGNESQDAEGSEECMKSHDDGDDSCLIYAKASHVSPIAFPAPLANYRSRDNTLDSTP